MIEWFSVLGIFCGGKYSPQLEITMTSYRGLIANTKEKF